MGRKRVWPLAENIDGRDGADYVAGGCNDAAFLAGCNYDSWTCNLWPRR